jgi:hypothetical protein
LLLAESRRHYADLAQRDYKGPSGHLVWDWQVSGKTLLDVALKRELGAYQDITDNYIVTDALALTPSYQATAKTQLQSSFYLISRRFLGDPGFVIAGTERRVDHVKGVSQTLNYDATRYLRLSATAKRELRVSNIAGFNYGDTSATLSVQFTW